MIDGFFDHPAERGLEVVAGTDRDDFGRRDVHDRRVGIVGVEDVIRGSRCPTRCAGMVHDRIGAGGGAKDVFRPAARFADAGMVSTVVVITRAHRCRAQRHRLERGGNRHAAAGAASPS